jgi:hypothetical protein
VSEDQFPTIAQAHAVLFDLIKRGFGELPVQILIAPDSTIQALARDAGATDDQKPALMLEFENGFCVISTAYLDGAKPRVPVQ